MSRVYVAYVDNLLSVAEDRTKSVRNWRNKQLAHRDLLLALKDPSVDPVPDVTIEKVDKAFESVRQTMNLLSRRYTGGVTAFDIFVAPGDADALVSYLSLGFETDESERQRQLGVDSNAEDVN